MAWLPVSVGYRISDWVGDITYFIRVNARRAVTDNMRHVLGPEAPRAMVRACAREAFRSVARYYFDLIKTPHQSPEELFRKRLIVHGFEHLQQAVASGRGVIVFSGHFGNPEMAVQAALAHDIRILTLTEPLNPPILAAFIRKLRSSLGQEFPAVNLANIKIAIRRLKRGGVIGIMGDRDVQGTGVPMKFFGDEAVMPTGAVELAMRVGAVIMPIFAHRRPGNKIEVFIYPPLEMARTGSFERDVRTNVATLLGYLERHISQDPGQWMVLEPVWQRHQRGINGVNGRSHTAGEAVAGEGSSVAR